MENCDTERVVHDPESVIRPSNNSMTFVLVLLCLIALSEATLNAPGAAPSLVPPLLDPNTEDVLALFDPTRTPADLIHCARRVLRNAANLPSIDAAVVTPQNAMSLYDRLVEAAGDRMSIWDLKRLLGVLSARHPAAFMGVAAVMDLYHDPVVLVLALPDCGPPPTTCTLPAEIVDLIAAIVADFRDAALPQVRGLSADAVAAVRRRYSAPFDGVFPRNSTVAKRLLRGLAQRGRTDLLADLPVVLALLQHGIRFWFRDFIMQVRAVDATQIAALYPMLAMPPLIDEVTRAEHVLLPLQVLVGRGQHDVIVALLQTRQFLTHIGMPELLCFLEFAIAQGHLSLVEDVISLSPGLVNVPNPETGRTLLHYAFMYGRSDLASSLLKLQQIEPELKGKSESYRFPSRSRIKGII